MMITIPEKMKNRLMQDATCYANVTSLISNVEDFYCLTPEFFPDYTIHGVKHVDAVLALADKLITSASMAQLSSRDLSYLISAIVIHDLGMFLTVDGVEKLLRGTWSSRHIEGLDNATWEEEWKAYVDRIKRYPDQKMNYVFGECISMDEPCLDRSAMVRKDYLIFGDFLRQQHHRLAHEIAETKFMGSVDKDIFAGTSFDEDDRRIIGLIARSHGMAIRDTEDYIIKSFADANTPCNSPVFYLMAILRIADYLDAGQHRAPKSLEERQAINVPVSVQEWKWNRLIKMDNYSWKRDQKNLFIQASPQDSTDFVLLEKWLKSVQTELDMCWSVIAEKYSSYNYRLSIHRIQSNILNPKIKASFNQKFLAKEARLTANPDLLKLLIQPLYGDDPSFGVRELIQNAVDACIEREHLDPECSGLVTVAIDTKNKTFTICDNGIGMNEDVLLNYYLAAGSSYRFSDEWIKDFTTQRKSDIVRSGKFGVGVLSTFLLGCSIHVKTRHMKDDLGYEFQFGLEDRHLDIKRVECEIGTTITVKLSDVILEKLLDPQNVYDACLWNQWYLFEKPIVQYLVDGTEQTKLFESVPQSQDESPKWFKVNSDQYDTFLWRYSYRNRYCCNGIVIPSFGGYRLGYNFGMNINVPSFSLVDTQCNLKVDLSRKNILEFPDEAAFIREAYRYFLAKLLIVDWTNPECINQNLSQGFLHDESLRRSYLSQSYEYRYILSRNGYTLLLAPFVCKINLSRILLISCNDRLANISFNVLQTQIPFCLFLSKNKRQSIDFYRNVINTKEIKPPQTLYHYRTNIGLMHLWAENTGFNEVKDKLQKTLFNEYNKVSAREDYYRFDAKSLNPKESLSIQEKDLDGKRFPIIAEYAIQTENQLKTNLFLDVLQEYLGDDIWIPFDMDARKKKFPKAFEQLKYYLDRFAE